MRNLWKIIENKETIGALIEQMALGVNEKIFSINDDEISNHSLI
jgi:hypothetical protein